MAYKITKTDGSLLTTIADYTVDSTTILNLPGRGVVNYGQIIAENFVYLLENSSSPVPPQKPLVGQIWFHTNDNSDPNNPKKVYTIKVFTGDMTTGSPPGWKQVGGTNASSSPPPNPNLGDLWYDGINKVLYTWDGSKWVSVSAISSEDAPQSPNGGAPVDGTKWTMMPEHMEWIYDSSLSNPEPPFTRTGGKNNGQQLQGGWKLVGPMAPGGSGTYSRFMTVKDKDGWNHDITVQYQNGIPLAVWSKDWFQITSGTIPNFTTKNNSNGLQTIWTGLNGNDFFSKPDGSTDSFLFNGNATNAWNLDNLDSSKFLGRGDSKLPTSPASDNNADFGNNSQRWRSLHGVRVYAGGSTDDNNVDTGWVNLLGKAAGASWADKLNHQFWIKLTGDVTGSGYSDGSYDFNISTSISDDIRNSINNAQSKANEAWNLANQAAGSAGGALTQGSADNRYIKFTGTEGQRVSGQLGSGNDNRFDRMFAERFIGEATSSDYSDLAEYYETDADYIPGTLVKIGGPKEITQTTGEYDLDLFGVISDKPGVIMNNSKENDPTYKPVALSGRVPVRVTGKVNKGDRLVPSRVPGVAMSIGTMEDILKSENKDQLLHSVLGRALTSSDILSEKTVECYVQSRH